MRELRASIPDAALGLMFDTPIVVNQFGVDWTPTKWCAVVGGLLLVAATLLFVVLFKHTRAKSYRLSQEQLNLMLQSSEDRNLDSLKQPDVDDPATALTLVQAGLEPKAPVAVPDFAGSRCEAG
jgi:hypothetical protein